ncbi:hypothetical protein ABT275_33775 [Streptomyces sp. NPDC001185]|uniref:hypothetical protein n=1 Tax=Streptomyces sp. NPDC001185 TaxID=3154380 RepID=UPI003321F7C5
MQVVSAALSAVGSLSFVLGLVVLVVVFAVLLFVVRPVVKKTRAEDVPATLVGLSHVIAALASFLPWSGRPSPARTPEAHGADGQPGGAAPTSPTIITTDRLTVMRPPDPPEASGLGQITAAPTGGE